MKIPKQRGVIEKAEDGKHYIKMVPIPFPILSYILSFPVRAYRSIVFQLRVWGIRSRPSASAEAEGSTQNAANQTKAGEQSPPRPIQFGSIQDQPVDYQGNIGGQSVAGSVRIEFEFIDTDEVDGTDVIRFSWQPDGHPPYTTHHSAEFFLRALIDRPAETAAEYFSTATSEWADAFENSLSIREAKALVDDRSYERIQVSGEDIEIRLKYTGLLMSLAAHPQGTDKLLVLLSGILSTDDILDPVLFCMDFAALAEANSVAYDDAEAAWVPR